jgi:hypothetical protein
MRGTYAPIALIVLGKENKLWSSPLCDSWIHSTAKYALHFFLRQSQFMFYPQSKKYQIMYPYKISIRITP